MSSQRGKVLWQGNRCLVGGSAELRLYEYEGSDPTSTSRPSAFTSLSVVTELPGLRAFAWYPHTDVPIVAAGLTTGRVLVVKLGQDGKNPVGTAHSSANVVQINVRHQRPCNVVAFAPSHPGLLAIGLEKGRGESLLVYDINSAARSFGGGATHPSTSPTQSRGFSLHRESSQSGRGRANSPATSAPSGHDLHPLLSFGSSEVVNSAAFLYAPVGASGSGSSPLLAAGMAGKWLRVYDVRSPSSTVTSWSTRSVHGIAANPFNAQQFVTHGDDGVVKMWDLRKPMDPLLSFSEADAGSIPSSVSGRLTTSTKALTEVNWCTQRRGVLGTLEKDATGVRIWNVVDGPRPRLVDGPPDVEASMSELALGGQKAVWAQREDAERPDLLRMPILLDDRRTPSFPQTLSSFAFATTPSPSSPMRIVGLSRDLSGPGSFGHLLEVTELAHPPQFSFLENGLITTSSTSLALCKSFQIAPEEVNALDQAVDDPRRDETQLSASPLSRGRAFTLRDPTVPDRNATPRPTAQLQRIASAAGDLVVDSAPDEADLSALAEDMSVLLRQRVLSGYGADAHKNAGMSEASLAEFWRWIGRAQALSGNSCLNDYDFRYRGVLRILHGFPLSSGSSGASTPRSSERRPNSSRSHRRPDDSYLKTTAYDSACAQLVVRRKLEHVFAISSSAFKDQRKLALQVCGAEWEYPWEAVCADFEKSGEYEAAAKHAFFSGQLEKSMNYLRLCKDRSLRMLAPILAAYLSQRNSSHGGSESTYAELCQSLSLSTDIDAPWVRALFAFLASGEWREVGNEMGLPLRDRVAVALRFLSDSELVSFLRELDKESLPYGDLEAVLLFGLRNDGLTLLSNYVDRTSDVQTAALAYSFVSPGLIRNDLRVIRWIETYRSQLDQLQLWSDRAKFDTARGVRARAAMEQSRLAGKPAEANEVATLLRRIAPAQMVIRCGFCATNLGSGGALGREAGSGARSMGTGVSGKTTLCPSCSKQLPACCICLTRPSIHSFEGNGSSMLAWCSRCRHGGHATHVLEWFERSEVCAVAGCDCMCRFERGPGGD
ncbi:hypothetical protein JCM10212_000175 [Sporobolomyces blumeae]